MTMIIAPAVAEANSCCESRHRNFSHKSHLEFKTHKTNVGLGYGLKDESNGTNCSLSITANNVNTFCRDGRLKEALDVMHDMSTRPVQVDSNAYASLLQACTNLKCLAEGKLVHSHMVRTGIELNNFIGAKLVIMYVNCGSLIDGRLVFNRLRERNMFSWTAMIGGYAKQGHCEEALKLYYEMQEVGIQPDQFIFPSVLKACAGLASLEQGKDIHNCIARFGYESDVFVGNALIDMYAKCGSIDDARQVFDKMSKRDVVSWNAMIGGYAQNGHGDDAIKLFHQMQLVGVKPNVVSWNVLISGFVQNGLLLEVLELFGQMLVKGYKPDMFTLTSILSACASLSALQQGKEIHAYIIRRGFESNSFVGCALIGIYAKCRHMENARQVFDRSSRSTVVPWNTMIAGYAQHGNAEEAFQLFTEMQLAGVKADVVTWNGMISGYVQNGHVDEAWNLFHQMQLAGTEPDLISWNLMIGAYVQSGQGYEAQQLFGQMELADIKPNVISWNVIITGYTQNGQSNQALKLFRQMQFTGMKPNSVTISSVLSACANLSALQKGKEIHGHFIRSVSESDAYVGSALLDMYAKCGSIEDAERLFNKMSQRDVVFWNVMILSFAMHRHGKDSLTLFTRMLEAGMKPDHWTFTGVLSACSHAGLVEEGWQYFDCMSQDYHITPNILHYACMVDLLGRAGQLDEAQDFINMMPLEPEACVWRALLGTSKIHCNIDLGKRAAEHLFELDPEDAGNYVLLSNIYAAAGRWDDVAKVRKLMKDKGLKRNPGCSWIEVKNTVHAFIVGDRSHPQTDKIYATLKSLAGQMEEAGYVPDTNFVLNDVAEERKELILCGHSERLAIAFGLMNTRAGTSIQIIKNLRMCGDCHTATKFLSKIVGREIVVRDANRFHHFKYGLCSCRDYW